MWIYSIGKIYVKYFYLNGGYDERRVISVSPIKPIDQYFIDCSIKKKVKVVFNTSIENFVVASFTSTIFCSIYTVFFIDIFCYVPNTPYPFSWSYTCFTAYFYHYILRFIFSYVQPILFYLPPPLLSFYFHCLCLLCLRLNPSYTPPSLLKIFYTLIICCHLVPYYYYLGNILSDPSQHCYLPDLLKKPLKNISEISTMF